MGGCRSAGSSGGSASDCGVGYPGGRTPRCSIRAPNASASAVAQSTLADRFATIALDVSLGVIRTCSRACLLSPRARIASVAGDDRVLFSAEE